MKELLRTSPHQPVEEVAVRDHLVPVLLASGQYEEVGNNKSMYDKAESPVFKESMTEKEIKALIIKYNIELDYDIDRERKADKLKELEKLGYKVVWK